MSLVGKLGQSRPERSGNAPLRPFLVQFSKLYAFPVGANGDALLADYLNDPSAAPPGMKPLFNTPEHLLPAGWGVCASKS